MSSSLERALEADKRVAALKRDAMLLSFALGGIPEAVRKMQFKADDCASAIESLIGRLEDICPQEVSETASEYYALVERNRECGKLLTKISQSLNEQLEAFAKAQQRERSERAQMKSVPRRPTASTQTRAQRS